MKTFNSRRSINNQRGASVLLIVFGISMLIFTGIGTLHLYVDARARIQRQLQFSNKSFLMSANLGKVLESARRRWDNLGGNNQNQKIAACTASGGKHSSITQNGETIHFCLGASNDDRCVFTEEGLRACICLGTTVGNDLNCADHNINYTAKIDSSNSYENFVNYIKDKYYDITERLQNRFDRTLVAAVDSLFIGIQNNQNLYDNTRPIKVYAAPITSNSPTYNSPQLIDDQNISSNEAKFGTYHPINPPTLQSDPWANSPTLGIAPPAPIGGAVWPSAITYQSCPEGASSCPSIRICLKPDPTNEPNRTVCFEQRLTRGTCASSPFTHPSWNNQNKPDFNPTSQCSNVYF